MSSSRDAFATWIGASETRHDRIGAAPLVALAATLDLDPPATEPGDPLPPLAHWLYALPMPRASEVGGDGHARRGGFLPPVGLPRRMWAGGRLQFREPLRVGDAVTRVSTIESITSKQGRNGELVFVTVRHDWSRDAVAGTAFTEWQDIVYRDVARAGIAAPTPDVAPVGVATWSRLIVPDPVLLFRYSALTFNAHRIHYDLGYVRDVEGYPGLVVHGPLIATLLIDLLRREAPATTLMAFAFKSVAPLFDTQTFHVNGTPATCDGEPIRLWASGTDGAVAMEASATVR